jgi:hypothetical protein
VQLKSCEKLQHTSKDVLDKDLSILQLWLVHFVLQAKLRPPTKVQPVTMFTISKSVSLRCPEGRAFKRSCL